MSTFVGRQRQASQRRRARRAERTATWLPRWRNRRSRRRLCVGMVSSLAPITLAVGLAMAGIDSSITAITFAVLWVGGIVALMACWGVLQVLTGYVGELPTGMLDEREAAAHNAARATGFQLGIYAALVPMTYLFFSSSPSEPSTTAYPGGMLVAIAVFIGSCSPTAIVAWRQVDDEPDEIT